MKIKTITCHNVYNFGASLQAHALYKYLSNEGHDVEVIDYVPNYVKRNISLFAIGSRWNRNIFIKTAYYIYVIPMRILQFRTRKKFDKFTQSYIKLTKRYNSFDELKNDPPKADLYICGSDQIWNPEMQNGLDPAFYLDFAPKGTIRASYAASFSIKEIPDKYISFIKNCINKLDYISVREKSALKILDTLSINNNYTQVLDPVFLLPKNYWIKLCNIPNFNDYILVYDQENNQEIKKASQFLSKKLNKKIIAFKELYPKNYAHKTIKYAGPQDFIGLIYNARIILTNSFHCTAFSIILNKEFYVFPRTHQKVNSRMVDLLSSLNLSERYVNDHTNINTENLLNYENINHRLLEIKKDSISYINKITNG